jgi:hypothetical protein
MDHLELSRINIVSAIGEIAACRPFAFSPEASGANGQRES